MSIGLPVMLAVVLALPRLGWSQAQRLGPEFQVNTYTYGYQYNGGVAAAADGDFVVVWSGAGAGSSLSRVFAQRYTSAGSAVGGAFQVSPGTTPYDQYVGGVAAAADGDFVVVWQNGSDSEIFGRRFTSAGIAAGAEFQVNTYTTGGQYVAGVAAAADGAFVVVWSSYEPGNGSGESEVFARRFTSAGVAANPEFRVNTYTTGGQYAAGVAAAADGAFVVMWSSYHQDGDYSGVFARRYTSAGAAAGPEIQVNTFTRGSQYPGGVAAASDGAFVVVWSSYDQDYSGVFARRYTSAGVPVGGEFQVNTYTSNDQAGPAVAIVADSNFVVTWTSAYQDGSYTGVFGQRFAFSGATTPPTTTSTSTSTTSSTSDPNSSTTTSSLPVTTTTVTASTTTSGPSSSTTTVTLTASTTTTVASLSTFLGRLSDALPDEVTAPDKKSHNTAKKLGKLESKASTKIGKCTDASGSKQQKLCKKARGALNKLLNAAKKANEKGSLGVPLDPIDQAVTGALTLLPA